MTTWKLREDLVTAQPREVTVVQDSLLDQTTSTERVTQNRYEVIIQGITLELCRRDLEQVVVLFKYVLDKYEEEDKAT